MKSYLNFSLFILGSTHIYLCFIVAGVCMMLFTKTVFQTEKSTKVKEKIISNILQHKRSFEIMSVGRTLKSCLSNQNFEHGKMFLSIFVLLFAARLL